MKQKLTAFFAGLIFSIGLGVAGMTQPQKIIGFLDFFGSWDPTLLFVMFGAVGLHFFTYRWIRNRSHPLFCQEWNVPSKTQLTWSLVIGSSLFGIGWGLSGFCPGPGVISLASFETKPFVFVVFMLIGMLAFRQVEHQVKK